MRPNRVNTAVARAVARILVRVVSRTALRVHRRPGSPEPLEPRASGFDVYTFVTDDEQYEELRSSLAAAGLEPPLARFVALQDRRSPAGSDPYELIARIGADRDRRHAILVHQDVRFDQGAGVEELVAVLEQLDALDPRWVVAGNAGGTARLGFVRRLRDPHGGSSDDSLPARVVSLDENLLIFNPAREPRCSPELGGFHFYGTDVCLNALKDGGTAYVIDFPVTHLSAGRRGPDYEEARERFTEVWQRRFLLALVCAPTEIFFLSRSALVRRLLDSQRVRAWVLEWERPASSWDRRAPESLR